jgi:translation initiation factor IF-3
LKTNYRKQIRRPYYILNERITAPTVRLIDANGKQIKIFERREALNLSQEKGLDLVLIASQANPPVVKLIDFKKFLYQERKKQKEARKGVKKSIIKDIKLSLFIGKNDFQRLIKKAQKFLKAGHQVRIGLLLKGREVSKKPMAFDLVNHFIKTIGDITISTQPRIQGRVIIAIIDKKK